MKTRDDGFTLMELMVVLALAAIVLAVAVPSFQQFTRNNRITGIANDFLGTLHTARTEALKQQAPVSICPSNDPESDEPTCSDGGFTGWIVFADPDGDCNRDADEDVVRVGLTIPKEVKPASNVGCVSFAASGFRERIADKDLALQARALFCDDRGNTAAGGGLSAARGVEVTPTGRARITRDVDEIGEWAGEADPVKCPELAR